MPDLNNEPSIKDVRRRVQLRKSQRITAYVNARERSAASDGFDQNSIKLWNEKYSKSGKITKTKAIGLLNTKRSSDDEADEELPAEGNNAGAQMANARMMKGAGIVQ